jgi:hypothetical protein
MIQPVNESNGADGGHDEGLSLEGLSRIPDWDWPQNASDILLAVLRNPDADETDRVLAAELAGHIVAMNDAVADALLALVKDTGEAESVRGRAAIALGPTLEMMETYGEADLIDDSDEQLVSEAMHQAIRDGLRDTWRRADTPKEVRRRVLEASVRGVADWHPAAVRAAWHGEDAEWKLTAVFCMRFVDGFDDEIVEALESPDPRTRYEAVRAAGAHEVRRAWPYVRVVLEDPEADKPLLLAAIEAAGAIDPDEAETLFLDLDESDPDIADAIADALALYADPDDFDDESMDDDEGRS